MASPAVSSPSANGARPRLASLDALRGFDMFWLIGGAPVVIKLTDWLAPGPVADAARRSLTHAAFGETPLRPYDLVMPLFLFLAGVAMAFSGPWADDAARFDRGAWLKLLRRAVLLWVAGMAVQGNLFTYDPGQWIFYSNTLQAIAAGGFVASLVALLPAGRARLAAFASLPVAYFAITALAGGGYDRATNPALALDNTLMGETRGDASYAWVLPSLNFGFTVLAGVYAGRLLRTDGAVARKAAWLAAAGVASLVASSLLAPLEPVNKHLWTGTFCLWSGGWCLLLLAGFHAVVDGLALGRWVAPLRVIGVNSLAAYLIAGLLPVRATAAVFLGKLDERLSPGAFGVVMAVGTLGVTWGLLAVMHRHRIYLKL